MNGLDALPDWGVCRVPGHTAKPKPHTAKALSCVAHGEEHTANPPTVNLTFTHGQIVGTRRSFAVSQSRHTAKKR
jgi:hypothetical protein